MVFEQPQNNPAPVDHVAAGARAALAADVRGGQRSGAATAGDAASAGTEYPYANPYFVGLGGAAGSYLGAYPIPSFLDKAATFKYSKWLGLQGTLGTHVLGSESFVSKALAEEGPGVKNALNAAERQLNELSRGPIKQLAEGWKEIRVSGNAAESVAESSRFSTLMRGLGLQSRAAATEGRGVGSLLGGLGMEGRAAAATTMEGTAAVEGGLLGTAKQVLSNPAVRTGLQGAAVFGGTMLADRLTSGLGEDNYHLAVPGIAAAMLLPEGTGVSTRVAVGASALVLGKIANGLAPASPHLSEVLKPGFADTALLAGSLALPINGEAKLWAAGGAYALGRMSHMNDYESFGTAAAIGGLTYLKTHNQYIAAAAGAGSYVGSTLLSYLEPRT
jgi:hypothetical protein